MPVIYEAPNGVWYKKETEREKAKSQRIEAAVQHAVANHLPHSIDQIRGHAELKNELGNINSELASLKQSFAITTTDVEELKKANSRIHFLEKKLFYNAWFFKNGTYDHLEFDTFENSEKLFYGTVLDGKLVPNKSGDYSIYRSVKFVPQMTKSLERYMFHVEYNVFDNGGLVVEVSFDNGNKFHTVLSTINDPSLAYYYQYPDFCGIDNSIAEVDSNSLIVRFRLLANASGTGVEIISYGVMLG